MQQPEKVIAVWNVLAETYQELVQEATADAQLFMHGSRVEWNVDVINASPKQFEDRRVIEWQGQALITVNTKAAPHTVYR